MELTVDTVNRLAVLPDADGLDLEAGKFEPVVYRCEHQ